LGGFKPGAIVCVEFIGRSKPARHGIAARPIIRQLTLGGVKVSVFWIFESLQRRFLTLGPALLASSSQRTRSAQQKSMTLAWPNAANTL